MKLGNAPPRSLPLTGAALARVRRDPDLDPRPQNYLEQQVARLGLFYEVSRSFAELDIERFIHFVAAKTKSLLCAESCTILLLDEVNQELYLPFAADVDPGTEERLNDGLPADRGVAGWVLREGIARCVPEPNHEPWWHAERDGSSVATAAQSLLCAPLRTRRATLGVIEVRNRIDGRFTQEDVDLLSALSGSIAVAIENSRLQHRVGDARRASSDLGVPPDSSPGHHRFDKIVGARGGLRQTCELMESAIASPVNVLLHGETGTGKELIARAIHHHGPRRDQPFVAVNCAALPQDLLESELFGHKRGAFTGAVDDKRGLFEAAHGGTILLDEIGETAPAMQVKLLRTLESGEMLRVGETSPRFVDVRIISATNRDLEADTARGRFREDLYYRLSTFPIRVPPLRERRSDIPLLAEHALDKTGRKFGKCFSGFTGAALDALGAYHWPGNVRELENEIERAAALAENEAAIDVRHLSPRLSAPSRSPHPVATLREVRDQFERDVVLAALRRNGGNVTRTAKELGLSRSTLIGRLDRYEPPKRNRRRSPPRER